MGLDLGIRSGQDAASMARDLKQYLQHPDKLFRRVRDEHGNLHLSKAAADFHPGRGVYRSSYMNARRLAATETNIAYRTADHERMKNLDFVVGIEIHLSHNHTCKGRDGKPHPFTDICNELEGKYPKDFKFTGWHPHCRCYVTSVLKTDEEIAEDTKRILRGEPVDGESENTVEEVPEGYKKWVEKNEERIKEAREKGTLPYFVRDNEEMVENVKVVSYKSKDNGVDELQEGHRKETFTDRLNNLTIETINDPQFVYTADSSKLSYKTRVKNLLDTIEKAFGDSDPHAVSVVTWGRSVDLSDGAKAKRAWSIIRSWNHVDMRDQYNCINHLNELRTVDLSAINPRWKRTFNGLIQKINDHDMKKGYLGVYSEIEHAYNIYKLSTTESAIKFGLGNLSDKTPYQLFTEFRRLKPNFRIPQKEFFDRFDKFVPLHTSNPDGKGAYFSTKCKHVRIPVSGKSFERTKNSKWREDSLFYHEYGHAFDAEKGMIRDSKLTKIYDDWKSKIAKDKGFGLEAAIKKEYDEIVNSFKDRWIKDEERIRLEEEKNIASAKGDRVEYSRLNSALNVLEQKKRAKYIGDKSEQLGAVSDCLGAALGGGRWINPFCHKKAYFSSREKQLNEFIAHCSENYWSGNYYFKKLAPELYKNMREYIKFFK